jgi:hypothetical protein
MQASPLKRALRFDERERRKHEHYLARVDELQDLLTRLSLFLLEGELQQEVGFSVDPQIDSRTTSAP